MKLPTRLDSEPIVDAIFEIRFSAKTSVANIFPGVLFAQLGGIKVERMGAADLPDAVRMSDPNFRAMAVQKVYLEKFYILVGDESLAVGCQLPYPGWKQFQHMLVMVLKAVAELHLIDLVTRYSLKYVDILPSKDSSEALSMLQIGLEVGGRKLESEAFQIRVELVRENFVHVVQSVGDAHIVVGNASPPRRGSILDIDSICNLSPAVPFAEFMDRLSGYSDHIHHENKVLFFECLKEETVQSLGPKYE